MDNGDMPVTALSNGEHAADFLAGKEFARRVSGLSKREYFAGLALQGLIASDDEGDGDRIEEIPAYAVAIADALLAELEK